MTADEIGTAAFDIYLDGGRDVCLALITAFETKGHHQAADFCREALFVVESERAPL